MSVYRYLLTTGMIHWCISPTPVSEQNTLTKNDHSVNTVVVVVIVVFVVVSDVVAIVASTVEIDVNDALTNNVPNLNSP